TTCGQERQKGPLGSGRRGVTTRPNLPPRKATSCATTKSGTPGSRQRPTDLPIRAQRSHVVCGLGIRAALAAADRLGPDAAARTRDRAPTERLRGRRDRPRRARVALERRAAPAPFAVSRRRSARRTILRPHAAANGAHRRALVGGIPGAASAPALQSVNALVVARAIAATGQRWLTIDVDGSVVS